MSTTVVPMVETAASLLARLRGAGATVFFDGTQLRIRARRGVLDEATRHALTEHRDELVRLVDRITISFVATPASLVAHAKRTGARLVIATLADGRRAVAIHGPADERFRRAVRECEPYLINHLDDTQWIAEQAEPA